MKIERLRAFEEAAKLIPHTWLDPLLSGPERAIRSHGPYTGADIEALLIAVRKRIEGAATMRRRASKTAGRGAKR